MNQEKPKNYYSLNLTEGRIFIIFITILIIVCVAAFGVALIISNSRKANDVNVNLADENNLNLNSKNFSYYEELDEDNKVDSFAKNSTKNTNAKSNENFKLEVQENQTEGKENNASEAKKTDSNSNEIVKIDDSEVVYSSKYIDNSTSNEKIKKQTATSNTKKNTTKKPIQQTKKELAKRYIVQVGSYINKKTAEEISLFYQIQGYPAYITQTINNQKTYYRLRVGPFKEKNVAEGYLTSLKTSKYGEKSYISIVYL